MQISANLGHLTKFHSVLALCAGLLIAGTIGRATAISPTVDAPIRWAGGVPVIRGSVSDGAISIYTVPAGANLLMTDIIISSVGSSPDTLTLYTGNGADCGSVAESRIKLRDVMVPANDTVVIPLVTGFGFTPGQTVCILSEDVGVTLTVNARGFLFTSAPAG